jgi:hypothetical protein
VKTAPKKKAPAKATAKKKVAKRAPAKKAASQMSAPKAYAKRADLGAPIDGFFAQRPPEQRPLLEALRAIIEDAAPDATSAIKWGNPFYTVGGVMMCALTAHKAHVNVVLAGPPGTFADPEGRLTGDGKTGRHLKLTSLAELPRTALRAWVRKAAEVARANA